jgi:3-oxoacyl-[acyl-carrier-protein] synthase-3
VSAACTSWVVALKSVRDALIADNLQYGLAVASETILSRVAALDTLNDNMWGDGSGAVVVRHDPDGDPSLGLIYARSYLDGEYAHLIVSRGMGTDSLPGETRSPYLVDAPSVQRFAIQAIPSMILEALRKANIGPDRSIWLLPHNANLSMVNRIGEKVGVPPERILTTIVDRGNMSSASIPVTLAREVRKGAFRAGDVLVLAGFGAGMTVGIILYVWPG